MSQFLVAAHEESRAGQERDGQRGLDDHEQTTGAATQRAADNSASTRAQRAGRVHARRGKGRQDAKQEAGRENHERAERERSRAQAYRHVRGQLEVRKF